MGGIGRGRGWGRETGSIEKPRQSGTVHARPPGSSAPAAGAARVQPLRIDLPPGSCANTSHWRQRCECFQSAGQAEVSQSDGSRFFEMSISSLALRSSSALQGVPRPVRATGPKIKASSMHAAFPGVWLLWCPGLGEFPGDRYFIHSGPRAAGVADLKSVGGLGAGRKPPTMRWAATPRTALRGCPSSTMC